MRTLVGMIGAIVAFNACAAFAQVTLSTPPTAPVTVCVKQGLPPADSWMVSVDGGAPQAVTMTSPADPSKCVASDTHSFTLPASALTAGTHTLRLTATKGTKTKLGPTLTVIVEAPEPGEPVITNVVASSSGGVGVEALATVGLGAGSATFGLALPQGAASGGLRVGALSTQTDVKTRWADGSIRFAVISAQVPSAGQYVVTAAGGSPAGAVTPTWPSASVTFTISGTPCVAALPSFSGTDSWLVGSVVRESRVVVAPRCGSADHPLLQVVYDVRSYAAGGHRVDICVQNVRDITAGNAVSYDVSISIGGQAVFSRTGLTQAYLTRWRKTFTTGGLVEATVTPDVEPFYASKALPRFHAQVVDFAYGPVTDSKYDILNFGDMSKGMGSPGGRPELGPYPEWVVRYLIHKKPAARAYMLRHADLSGSWSGHITKSDGKTSIRLDEWPNYWLDARAGTNPNGPNATRGGCCPSLSGLTETLENAHLPNLTVVPYLLTGDRFYLDQQKFWAHFVLLWTWPGDGWRGKDGAKGVLYQNQIRGFGWGLLKVGETAAFLPDDDPDKSYFAARVMENLAFLDRRPVEDPGGPLTVPLTARMGPDAEGYASTSMWQVSYLAYAVDRVRQLGWTGGTAFLRYAAGFQVRLFTSASDGYPSLYGAPYYPKVGRWVSGVVGEWFSMAQIYSVNFKSGAEPPQPFTGYYGPETVILLRIAQAQGIPRAQDALDYLTSRPGVMGDIYQRSGWAIASVGPGS